MLVQARIPVALATLHNFSREHEPEDDEDSEDELDDERPVGGRVDNDDDDAERNDGFDEQVEGRRDTIAEAMWTQYLAEHVRRGIPPPV